MHIRHLFLPIIVALTLASCTPPKKSEAFSERDKIVMRNKFERYQQLKIKSDEFNRQSYATNFPESSLRDWEDINREIEVMNHDSVSQYGIPCKDLPKLFAP